MILTVLQQNDPILREKSLKITKITPEIYKLIENMLETMYHFNGVGLAAPQVGQPIRLIVFDPSPERDQPSVLLNPEIVSHSNTEVERIEGCLSCRGFEAKVKRYEKVTVRGQTLQGKKITLKAEGLLGRVLQHETDHLNGVLITDIGTPVPPEEMEKDEPTEADFV